MGKPVPGLWQAEWQCGSCGSVVSDDRPGSDWGPRLGPPPRDTRMRRCRGVYMGKPRNRCGWTLSFVWIWVPPGGRGS
jgi:hypothetical protein